MEDISGLSNPTEGFPDVINLNVGGTTYTTTKATLTKYKSSMIAALFSGRYKVPQDLHGRFFIDRDGTYFSYILAFLREDNLPPEHLALKVLSDAEYFQLEGLITALEIYPSVFRAKLQNLLNEKFQIEHWKRQMITIAQEKCLQDLSPSGKTCFICEEDFNILSEEPSCVGKQHEIIVTKASKNGVKQNQETFDYLANRLKNSDCIISNVNKKDMDLFASTLQEQLKYDGYDCCILEEAIACRTIQNVHGYRKEACDFKFKNYHLEFTWYS